MELFDPNLISQLFPYIPEIAAGGVFVIGVAGGLVVMTIRRKRMLTDAPLSTTFSGMSPEDEKLRDEVPAVDMSLLLFPKTYTAPHNHTKLTAAGGKP